MTDTSLTVLRAEDGRKLTKTITPEGSVASEKAALFTAYDVDVVDLEGLFELLQHLRGDPYSAIVRGKLTPEGEELLKKGPILRRSKSKPDYPATFEDTPRRFVCFDFDEVKAGKKANQQRYNTSAGIFAVERILPEPFQDVDFVWQASSRAGTKEGKGLVKGHAWFELSKPLSGADLKNWAEENNLSDKIDVSLFHPVQYHYTADPLFVGTTDPIPDRLVKIQLSRRTVRFEAIDLGRLRNHKDVVARARKGEPLWSKGERNKGMVSLAGAVARRWPYEDPEGFFDEYLKDSFEAMAREHAEAPTKEAFTEKLREYQAKTLEERAEEIKAGIAPTRQLRFAKDLIKEYGEDLLYCAKTWFVWDGSRFETDELDKTAGYVEDVVKTAYRQACAAHDAAIGDARKATGGQKSAIGGMQSSSAFEGIRKLAAPMAAIRPEELDKDPWLLGTPEGVIELRTGDMRDPERVDRITKQTKVSPASIVTPQWQNFLGTTFQEDQELIGFVRRFLGSALIGQVTEELLVVFWGGGSNGKTVLLHNATTVLGDYAVEISPDVILSERSSKIDAERARLKGVRLAICAESSKTKVLDDGNLKQLCSSDQIIGKYLHKQPIRFTPSHQMILMTNHPPRVKSTDLGTWRRILMVPFTNTIAKEDRDKQLKYRLVEEEGPGILQWLIDGCFEYQERGLDPPEAVEAATAQYRAEQDEIGRFLEECTQRVPGGRAKAGDLYLRYGHWGGGEETMSRNLFGREMASRFKKIRNNGTYYVGLEIKETITGF
jgi:putative DNA primase/helicase